jgi:hypothetical protein
MGPACCERDTDGDGNCDRHPRAERRAVTCPHDNAKKGWPCPYPECWKGKTDRMIWEEPRIPRPRRMWWIRTKVVENAVERWEWRRAP